MVMKNYIILFVLLSVSIVGCDDDEGNNEAVATLQLNFEASFGDDDLTITNLYDYDTNLEIGINVARFFMSDIQLIKATGEKILVKDVEVVDFSQNHIVNGSNMETLTLSDIPVGDYTGIEFGMGINSDLNGAIPPDFENGHPLAEASEYWDWRETYVFSKLEGRIVKSTGEQTFFVYHTGTDALYKTVTLQKGVSIEENQTFTLNFQLDSKDWFKQGNGLLDVETNNISHSGPDDIWLADLIMTNMVNSIQLTD